MDAFHFIRSFGSSLSVHGVLSFVVYLISSVLVRKRIGEEDKHILRMFSSKGFPHKEIQFSFSFSNIIIFASEYTYLQEIHLPVYM